MEKEAYAGLWSLQKYRGWVFGAADTVHSDHNPLTYLTESAPKSAKLMRWALALQEFNVTFKYKPGKIMLPWFVCRGWGQTVVRTPVNADRWLYLSIANSCMFLFCFTAANYDGARLMMWMRRQFLPYASFEGGGMSRSTVSAGARRVSGSRVPARARAVCWC